MTAYWVAPEKAPLFAVVITEKHNSLSRAVRWVGFQWIHPEFMLLLDRLSLASAHCWVLNVRFRMNPRLLIWFRFVLSCLCCHHFSLIVVLLQWPCRLLGKLCRYSSVSRVDLEGWVCTSFWNAVKTWPWRSRRKIAHCLALPTSYGSRIAAWTWQRRG